MSLLSRRKFLIASGATAVGAAAVGGPKYVFAAPGTPNTGDTVVVVVLNGACDGVNMAGPIQTDAYQQLRGASAVAATQPLNAGSAAGANFSNETLFLHPRMEALYNGLWADGKMAVLPTVGIADGDLRSIRSHFAAVRYNANAQGINSDAATGWLSRMVDAQGLDSAVGSIDKGGLQLNGSASIQIEDLASLSSDGLAGYRDSDVARAAIAQLVTGDDSVSVNGQRSLQSITSLENLDPSVLRPNYPNGGFGQGMAEIATILNANIGLQAATIAMGGWDHHRNINGRYPDMIAEVSEGIQQLAADTNGLEEVTVLVTTEFGRTIRRNGNGGHDHGRARTELVLGAGITGGVYGDYPDALQDDFPNGVGNAMPVIVDHRQVITDIATARGDVADPTAVVPGFTPGPAIGFA